MAANRNEQLAKELGYQWSLKSWVEYDDSLLSKPQDQLTGYDKATLNINPDLKAKREAYQASLVRSNRLQSDLNNIQNAQQFLQNNVNQQKDRINKLYDLQDRAAAISASIQWTNRTAWGLWAASNVLNNSRWITDAQMQQQILQNDAQRESALSNVAQQEANIPSVLTSLNQANANAELARAQADYYNNQGKQQPSSSSSYVNKKNNNNNNDDDDITYEYVNWINWQWWTLDWKFIKTSDWNYYSEDWTTKIAYEDEKWNIIYTKDWQQLFWLDDVKADTIKRFPSSITIPTLKQTPWAWNNVEFKNISKRITL